MWERLVLIVLWYGTSGAVLVWRWDYEILRIVSKNAKIQGETDHLVIQASTWVIRLVVGWVWPLIVFALVVGEIFDALARREGSE